MLSPCETRIAEKILNDDITLDLTAHHDVGGISTVEYARAKLTQEEFRGACRFNVLKYVSRAGYKGSALEDYRKAMDYLQWLIESLELEET